MTQLTLTPVQMPGSKGIVLGASGAQTVGANAGISFVNNGQLLIALYIPGSYSGNLVQNFGRGVEGVIPAPVTVALTASTNYLFGPWSPSDFTAQDGTGLTNFGLSGTNTSVTVTLYQLVPVS